MRGGGSIAGAGAGAALVVASCAAPGARAPLVEGPVALAAERGGALEAAVRGRRLYVTTCTECHGAVRPSSLTEEEWAEVLPRMAKRAAIDAGEEADIRAYVKAARAEASAQ